jgi:hypothetical protein
MILQLLIIILLSMYTRASDIQRTLMHSTPGQCGKANPSTSTDCTFANIQTNYCCFMTPMSGGASFCSWIGPTTYLPSMTTYKLEGVNYKIDCDIPEGAQGTPCGKLNPTILDDCTAFSTDKNSCCLYQSGNINYCFWIGSKASGQVIATVTCSSCFISAFTILSAFLITILL